MHDHRHRSEAGLTMFDSLTFMSWFGSKSLMKPDENGAESKCDLCGKVHSADQPPG